MDWNSDIPDFGAAFTFGRSRFSNNQPGKFWIRNDPLLQVACGDEHTAILTASGRVFTFGNNEWGQLGHGHTKSLVKPTCVKGLKHVRATIIACGRSHTLVATDIGHVYGFGCNTEGQLGSLNEYTIHSSPIRVQGLEGLTIKSLCAGADHSMALTDKGNVFVWGSGCEGQLGMEKTLSIGPTELRFETSVLCISAGYYHSAFITVGGNLYTAGESDGGKLGLPEISTKTCNTLHLVSTIESKLVYVSCGGNHTIALTANGRAYSFGSGFNGQLGLGDRIVESFSPCLVKFLGENKVARVSCGENHTAFLTDSGQLYVCGDRRHGKLGLPEQSETRCSEFFPSLVDRFENFQVQQVASGGCHMVVIAVKQKKTKFSVDELDIVCPTRMKRNTSSQSSNLKPQRNVGSLTSVRSSNWAKLPSVSKSPVWYVPLEKTANGTQASDDEDEVLSKVERNSSLLNALEDVIIRHADSDIDSEGSETVELAETHIITQSGDILSLAQPRISDSEYDTTNESLTTEILDITQCEQKSKQLETLLLEKSVKSEVHSEYEEITVSKQNSNKKNANYAKQNKSRSHFYVDDENEVSKISKSSSTLSMSSACYLI